MEKMCFMLEPQHVEQVLLTVIQGASDYPDPVVSGTKPDVALNVKYL